MEQQQLKSGKYPSARIKENQKKYRNLRESLKNNAGEFTGNSPDTFLFPYKHTFTIIYITILIITFVICTITFIQLHTSGI